MNGPNAEPCPGCGSLRVTAAAPLDLCPACLLATALAVDGEPCPYQVVTPIADDGAAVIYLAQGLTVGGYVALKVLNPRTDIDEILTRYRGFRETLALVRHRGLARLLDVGVTEDGRLYLASEYVAGWPLSTIGSRPAIPIEDRTAIVRQLTEAIGAAHAAGVAHMKITADRVKISTAGGIRATILGLGSALIVDGLDSSVPPDLTALAAIGHDLGVEP
jgi:serine/threonine protein kinase